MKIDTDPLNTERSLMREKANLGALLRSLRGSVPRGLVGDREWENLTTRVWDLPVAVAAYPFGLELRLDVESPSADVGISMTGKSHAKSHFEQSAASESSSPTVNRIVRLLEATESSDSKLGAIADSKIMLEYDIRLNESGSYPEPAIFLYPKETVIRGESGGSAVCGLNLLMEELYSAVGWTVDDRAREHLRGVYGAAKSHNAFASAGVFPDREQAFRLGIVGYRQVDEVVRFLERVGCPTEASLIASFIAPHAQNENFDYMSIHLDVTAQGIGSRTGISIYAREGAWQQKSDNWSAILRILGEQGLVVNGKCSELTDSWCGADTVFASTGTFLLARGIHHIKLSFTSDNEIESVKAYVFMLMFKTA